MAEVTPLTHHLLTGMILQVVPPFFKGWPKLCVLLNAKSWSNPPPRKSLASRCLRRPGYVERLKHPHKAVGMESPDGLLLEVDWMEVATFCETNSKFAYENCWDDPGPFWGPAYFQVRTVSFGERTIVYWMVVVFQTEKTPPCFLVKGFSSSTNSRDNSFSALMVSLTFIWFVDFWPTRNETWSRLWAGIASPPMSRFIESHPFFAGASQVVDQISPFSVPGFDFLTWLEIRPPKKLFNKRTKTASGHLRWILISNFPFLERSDQST